MKPSTPLIVIGTILIGATVLIFRASSSPSRPSSLAGPKKMPSASGGENSIEGNARERISPQLSSPSASQTAAENPPSRLAFSIRGEEARPNESSRETSPTAPSPDASPLLAFSPDERVAFVSQALAQAAGQSSDAAVRAAIRFCDEDPAYALDYGRSLISLLGKAGDYSSALGFILAEDDNGWLGENGHKWLNSLFTQWTVDAPEQAATAALQATGPARRSEALQIVAGTWAKTDPAAAANFAAQLDEPAERDTFLAISLPQWSERDPAAAQAWLAARENREASVHGSLQR